MRAVFSYGFIQRDIYNWKGKKERKKKRAVCCLSTELQSMPNAVLLFFAVCGLAVNNVPMYIGLVLSIRPLHSLTLRFLESLFLTSLIIPN